MKKHVTTSKAYEPQKHLYNRIPQLATYSYTSPNRPWVMMINQNLKVLNNYGLKTVRILYNAFLLLLLRQPRIFCTLNNSVHTNCITFPVTTVPYLVRCVCVHQCKYMFVRNFCVHTQTMKGCVVTG